MAVDELMLLLFGGKKPPAKLAKRFTGDEAFCILETIAVDGVRLKIRKMNVYLVVGIYSYVDEFWTSVETMVFKPWKEI